MKCRACFGENLSPFVDLGMQPASNDYLEAPEVQTQVIYPLKMLVCEDCGLGQLSVSVSPKAIFSDYMYFSSMSPSWVEDRRQLANRMTNEFHLDKHSLVIDIGSNDGYYLKHFEGRINVLGYEPAENVAEVAREAGVPTHAKFWGSEGNGPCSADLINATNVLAHTPDLDGMIAGIAKSLAIDGTATLEFPLFSNLIRHNQLDTIYHEHYSYISIEALRPVLARHGLRIWRIEELPTHGGSVRVFACHEKARFLEEGSVTRVRADELWAPEYDFEEAAQKVKWDFLSFLAKARLEGQIVGYGAPAKATVLCNYLGLDAEPIIYTVDDSPAKQGKFVPGTNIPIVSFDHHAGQITPEYIIVFAWNLLEPIKAKLQKLYGPEWNDARGYRHVPKLVTAIPELTITNL